MKRFISVICLLVSFLISRAVAQDQLDFLAPIKEGEATAEQWAKAMTELANPESRPLIQKAVTQSKPFPKMQLVDLLSNSRLVVRIGAIEILEDVSGGDNGYNPWVNPTAKENTEPLKMWNEWAESSAEIENEQSSKLSPEKILTYTQQLLSDDKARVARAMRMLEGDNFNVVASIQQFIVDNPTLPAAKLAQLKQAQYELVLIKASRTNANHLSRDLVMGNRDQQLSALTQMKKMGMITIPIIRDFVDAPDALVRETAIDAILTVGGRQTLTFIAEQLAKESDVNVIHIAIQNLKNIGGAEALAIIEKFLDHKSEDLVVASISGISKINGGKKDSYHGSDFGNENAPKVKANANSLAIVKLLSDNRWRVRVAALEYTDMLKVYEAGPEVVRLLKNDKDEFVRHHAIAAAVALKLTDAEEILAELFLANDDLVPSLCAAFIKMKKSLPDDLLKHLRTREPDIIISSLKSFSSRELGLISVLQSFALSKNLDISCAALRLLADDEEKTKQPSVANIITDALKSNNQDKIDAVLNKLDLPKNKNTDPVLRIVQGQSIPGTPASSNKLDALYNAFLSPGGKSLVADSIAEVGGEVLADGGLKALLDALVALAKAKPDTEQAFKISLILTKAGDSRGLASIKENVMDMQVSKRAALAESLYDPKQADAVPIVLALLQDSSKQIRSNAIEAAFSNDQNKLLIQSALESISKEGSKISGFDAYNYDTENGARDTKTRPIFYQWAREQLSKEQSDERITILSLVLMKNMATSSDEAMLAEFTKNKNPWIRRAAWHSLGIINGTWYNEHLDQLLADENANVRASITDAHTRADSRWRHIFSDTESKWDTSYYRNSDTRNISANVKMTLEAIAKNDTSVINRFEAMFTLLSHSVNIDIKKFTDLIPKQNRDANVISRLSDYVESNYHRMGKGMRPLLAHIDFKRISQEYHSQIIKHFGNGTAVESAGPSEESGFSTFAGLAKTSDASAEPQHLSTPDDAVNHAAKRESLVVVFFEKAGCKKCLQVENYLKDMKQDFPLLEIKREFVDQSAGILLNNHLSNKLGVPSNQILKAPAVYTSAGYIVGTNINPKDLAKLLSKTMMTPDDKDWYSFKNETEISEAKEEVNQAFRDLTLPIVIAGGLLDGINPCAFATIIFFLSYLTIAKRSPKEIFFVGFSFILAVFLAYLSFGLLFSKALEWLTANESYQWIRNSLNYVFAGFAILVAVLSLRDWWRARQGRLEDMTLQLPSFLKTKIRGVIRENSKSSLYVFAAFGSGIAISVLELACTGQVYAPIIYKINEGSHDALTMLVIYNLAFVLPLIIIFGLAMGGMKSNSLINFQKNHTSTIKLLTAILFFILAAVLLFSAELSTWVQKFYPTV